MKIVHDWLGPIELPDDARRIISLAPSVTETLYLLGLGERLVGRSAFCWRPPETNSLPVISSYTKVRWELLKSLEPDLVLISTGVQRPLLQMIREAGYPIFPAPLPVSPYGILENVVLVGALLGVEEKATRLTRKAAARYEHLAGKLPPLRFYLEFDLGGPITIGRGSYVGEALRHVGLVNVFGDRPEAYFTPDLSEVPGLEPDLVIYEPKPNRPRSRPRAQELLDGRGWKYPLVVTGGDELAHYGPGFFGFLDSLVKAVEQLLDLGRR